MHMKKFFATTAREAMRKMKADLGSEAYVISNRKTANGVEILAMAGSAVDDLTQVPAKVQPNGGQLPAAHVAMRIARAPGATLQSPFKTLRDIAVHLPAAMPAAPSGASPGAQPPGQPVHHAAVHQPQPGNGRPAPAPGLNEQRLFEEVRSMKDLLESQLAGLVWRETEVTPITLSFSMIGTAM